MSTHERDVSVDEEAPERAPCGGAWAHVAPPAAVERMRARTAARFDAAAALEDLRTLLDSPLPTRPVRSRLLARALAILGGSP